MAAAQEVNRDEAERCAGIAETRLEQGDLDGALRFVRKSMRLFVTDRARVLERRILARQENTASTNASTNASNTTAGSSSSRPSTTTASSGSEGTAASTHEKTPQPSATLREHSPEQLAIVDRVLKLSSYYEVLEVSTSATEADIKRSYRRLALQLHPDKNAAPGADEAFKRVSDAFAVLSDPSKRQHYDAYGQAPSRSAAGAAAADMFSRAEFTPEEIFNLFFNGEVPVRRRGPGGFRVYTTSSRNGFGGMGGGGAPPGTRPTRSRGGESSFLVGIMQFLPLLILLFYLFSSSTERAAYSIQQQGNYNIRRETSVLKAEYFFDSYAATKYGTDPKSLAQLEREIEEDVMERLRGKCRHEENTRERYLRSAQIWGSASDLEKGRNMRTPSCDRLRDYQDIRRGLRT